jgi:hypothetical protein
LTLEQADFPPPRQIIGGGKICKEVRDYLAWMTDTRVRYGQEVVYFSVLNAGNYDYTWNGRSVTTEPYWSGEARPGPSSMQGPLLQ